MGYNFDRLSGHTKEILGKASGNKEMEVKGKAQHALAEMKHKAKYTMRKIGNR